jgi:hypothetical protein
MLTGISYFMKTAVPHSSFFAFTAYTGLGYLALILHHWCFYPDLGATPSSFSLVLIFGNLTSGTICFGLSLRILISWWKAVSNNS